MWMQLPDVKTAVSSLDSPSERRIRERLEAELAARTEGSEVPSRSGADLAAEARKLSAAARIVGRPRITEAPTETSLATRTGLQPSFFAPPRV